MKILSRESLRSLVASEPGVHNAIIIHEVNNYKDVEDIVKNCKNALVLEMDDITSDRVGGPTKQQVQEAVDSGYEIVACKQGISRSSAIAFLIEVKKSSPEEAVKVLDVKKHFPNELIMKHGLDIVGEHIKSIVTGFYRDMATYRGWRWQPHNLVTKYFKD